MSRIVESLYERYDLNEAFNDGRTVKELYDACADQIKNGNGDKIVLISSDDEGNDFHTLYYTFTANEADVAAYAEAGCFHDDNDPKDVILLG